ncbi:MAG: DUF2268 domain-containing putative Zn-dependent protease [Bacteroidota bacterium]
MKNLLYLFFLLGLGFPEALPAPGGSKNEIKISYQEKEFSFSKAEKKAIERVVKAAAPKLRALLPNLPEAIHLSVGIIERNLDKVAGVAGRADDHVGKGQIVLWISKVYPGGIQAAVRDGLPGAIYHEFHHLSRGWTIHNNKYGPGIPKAAVNEGLAVVFAEIYTGTRQEGNAYPPEVSTWVDEILKLPLDANYMHWVSGQHPDGREAIGYKAGNYIVRQALEKSGKDILELSQLSPREILRLAGFETSDN